jgi:hypothetical protein
MRKFEKLDITISDLKKDSPSEKKLTWYDEWDRAMIERDTSRHDRDKKRNELQETQKELSKYA